MATASESIVPSGVCRRSGSALFTLLLLRAPDAAALCSTSIRTWRTWDTAGKIPQPVRIGRKVFWRPDELNAWVAAGCPDRVTWEAIRKS
jgi:predicted DNA-binding transcriptional regulator AlpA